MDAIRAAVLSPGSVAVRSFPRSPVPKDGLIVKVELCGVCGSDKHLLAGHMQLKFPIVPGHEFVGRVDSIGPTAKESLSIIGGPLQVGDRIVVAPPSKPCGKCWHCLNMPQRPNLCANRVALGFMNSDEPPHVFGAFADSVYVHGRSWVFKVPDSLPMDRAVLAEPTAIALRAVERACAPGNPTMREGLGIDRSVVVIGAGPIGLLVIAVLEAAGASPIIATDMAASRLKMASLFGADVTIDAKETSKQQRLERIQSLTEGVGPDVVIEAAGAPAAFQEAIEIARRGGKIIELGHYTDGGDISVNPHMICKKDLDIHGSWSTPQVKFRSALAFLECSRIPVEQLITHRFPLDRVSDAIDAVGKEGTLKVVVIP